MSSMVSQIHKLSSRLSVYHRFFVLSKNVLSYGWRRKITQTSTKDAAKDGGSQSVLADEIIEVSGGEVRSL